MPTVDQIEQRLWRAAEKRAVDGYLRIAPDCISLLRDFIRGGAERVVAEGKGEDEEQIAVAETNIISYVTTMIIEAKTREMSRLHEPTFFAAHSALCPIWPFC